MGRSFSSPAAMGVYMSVILRLQTPPDQLMHLTCAAAVAACNGVEKAVHLRPGIKWTNDLVFGGKKLAGILTEMSLDATGKVAYAVVGIGVNCCQKPEDFAPEIRDMAGSLSMIAEKSISRAELAASMMEALFRMDKELLTGKTNMMEQYRQDCITVGKEISLVRGDEIRHGLAIGVDDEGALQVQFRDGHTEAVSSGEVSVRGLYGYV